MSVNVFTKQDASNIALDRHPQSIRHNRVDDDIKNKAEDGGTATRPRDTKVRRRYTLHWPYLDETDENTLITFEDDVRGTDYFTWNCPDDFRSGTTLTVRLDSPIEFDDDIVPRSVTINLVEV